MLYNKNIINSKSLGSTIHWGVRIIVFILLFYVFMSIIWLVKNFWIVISLLAIVAIILEIRLKHKKKYKLFVEYLEKQLYESINLISSNLQKENKNLRKELELKGVLNSGVVFEIENNLISKKVENALEQIIEKFNVTSKEFNNELKQKEKKFFVDKIVTDLNGIVDTYYDKMKKQNKQIMNCGGETQIELWKNSLKQNIFGKTKIAFEKMTILNAGKRIEKEVLLGIVLSIISVIEGIISIYIAIKG